MKHSDGRNGRFCKKSKRKRKFFDSERVRSPFTTGPAHGLFPGLPLGGGGGGMAPAPGVTYLPVMVVPQYGPGMIPWTAGANPMRSPSVASAFGAMSPTNEEYSNHIFQQWMHHEYEDETLNDAAEVIQRWWKRRKQRKMRRIQVMDEHVRSIIHRRQFAVAFCDELIDEFIQKEFLAEVMIEVLTGHIESIQKENGKEKVTYGGYELKSQDSPELRVAKQEYNEMEWEVCRDISRDVINLTVNIVVQEWMQSHKISAASMVHTVLDDLLTQGKHSEVHSVVTETINEVTKDYLLIERCKDFYYSMLKELIDSMAAFETIVDCILEEMADQLLEITVDMERDSLIEGCIKEERMRLRMEELARKAEEERIALSQRNEEERQSIQKECDRIECELIDRVIFEQLWQKSIVKCAESEELSSEMVSDELKDIKVESESNNPMSMESENLSAKQPSPATPTPPAPILPAPVQLAPKLSLNKVTVHSQSTVKSNTDTVVSDVLDPLLDRLLFDKLYQISHTEHNKDIDVFFF